MDIFKRACKLGPGGWKCPCCGPKKTGGSKDRAKMRRLSRRRLKVEDRKEIEQAPFDTVHPRELDI